MEKKLIVILGPTASGKSDLAVKLAKKFGGEIVSADSRQIYKGLDIGSGKITKKEMQGIPHHLLNVASLKRKFTVFQYQKLALKKIKEIQKEGKLPFLVGGTGFYILSVVDGISIPKVKPNWKLRGLLEKKSLKELFLMLKKLDPERAKTIERKNPRKLIRAIEIANKMGRVPSLKKKPLPYPVLIIGIKKSSEELKKAIQKRLQKRLKMGMIKEIKNLRESGVSWKRLEELGLEYRFIAIFLQKKITYQEMLEKLQKEIEHFSSRQMTWFLRDNRIIWIKNYKEAEKLTKKFLQ